MDRLFSAALGFTRQIRQPGKIDTKALQDCQKIQPLPIEIPGREMFRWRMSVLCLVMCWVRSQFQQPNQVPKSMSAGACAT